MISLVQFAKAIATGDSSTVQSLISSGSVDVNACLPHLDRPPAIVFAARKGQIQIVDILLRANARIDDCDARGLTACHTAAARADHDLLALLLAHQPDLEAFDRFERTAPCFAIKRTANDGGRSALMLLEAGASPDYVNYDYDDMFRFAASSAAAVQALTARGVDLRANFDSDNATPLHHAAVVGRDADVFHLLVNVCGIDLEARDWHGRTCIRIAAETKTHVALRWLLNAGADPDSSGSMPLHKVSYHSAVLLLAAGATVCARDNSGRTALHRLPQWAAVSIERPAAYPLLAASADLGASDDAWGEDRYEFTLHEQTIDPDHVERARREIAKARLDFVRDRALQVYIGLHSLRLDTLQMCEVLLFACGPIAQMIPFASGGRLRPHSATNSTQTRCAEAHQLAHQTRTAPPDRL
jgi:ankyrin repeat protein